MQNYDWQPFGINGLEQLSDGYTHAVTTDGVAFLFGTHEDSQEDSWRVCRIKPTAALFKDGINIYIWSLEAAAKPDEARPVAEALGMQELSEPIPVPPTGGWALVHCDPEAYTTLAALSEAYALDEISYDEDNPPLTPEQAEALRPAAEVVPELAETFLEAAREELPELVVDEPAMYGDAVIRAPYNETDYTDEITVTLGAATESRNWKPMTMPRGAFIARLCLHKEGPKDGPAFVLADMVPGKRLKTLVKASYGIGLDIDTGTPSAVVDAALTKLGCLAVRYTTHSHNKTKTEFNKDKITKFADGEELTDALLQRYCLETQKWDQSIVDTVEYIGSDHNEKGMVIQIAHDPMPKHRVIVLLAEPYDFAKEGALQKEAMERWGKVPEALAAHLGLPFDRSCVDPSRLFYFPRHAKGKPFEISLWGGPLFDYKTLELDGAFDALEKEVSKGKGKSQTKEGQSLGRWSIKRAHGFQIADVIEEHAPDRLRGSASQGYNIECPFDEDHSNAGDQEDRACFVVNAGMGVSEIFTISCRHESCRNKTNLDMLGKMIADNWFGKEVIEDEKYNAILEEGQERSPAAQKIAAEDRARACYKEAIERLHPQSSQSEIEAVAILLVQADLPAVSQVRAVDMMAERLKLTKSVVRMALKEAERAVAAQKAKKQSTTLENKGLQVFTYRDEYNFDDACDFSINALLAQNERDALPTISQMNGNAVRLDIRNGRAKFVELRQSALWSELNKLVTFVRVSDSGGAGARNSVDRDVAAHVYEQAYSNLPPAPEVLYTPVYRRDGSLLVTAKYHFDPEMDLNVLLILNDLEIPEVPYTPTESQMKTSLAWIRTELLSDFPFCDVDQNGKERSEPSAANALAMLITPFMRRMVSGQTPLFCITKPSEGTGATLLASLSMMLFDGLEGDVPSIHYTPNEEEMEKKLVAAIMDARSHLFFDDVKDFNNRVLLRAITSERIGGRILGRSQNATCVNNFIWIATGNNPKIGGEMHRRTCWIRLNAKTPKTGERKYRHPDNSGVNFNEFVRQNRGIAIHHVLTLVEYWQTQGMPKFSARRLSSFEDWSAKVGGVLMACGVEGFLDTRPPMVLDPEKAAEDEFLRELYKKFGAIGSLRAADLFTWAANLDLGIISGRTPEDRRNHFNESLRALEGRAFEANDSLFAIHSVVGNSGGIELELRPVVKL